MGKGVATILGGRSALARAATLVVSGVLIAAMALPLGGCGPQTASAPVAAEPKPGSPLSGVPSSSFAGNLRNGGIAAQSGEWVYYTGSSPDGAGDSGFTSARAIWKMRPDGAERVVLLADSGVDEYQHLNVVDGWIYFEQGAYQELSDRWSYETQGIYRMRTDGTGLARVLYDPSGVGYSDVTVLDGWIYYKRQSEGSAKNAICRAPADGTGNIQDLADSGDRWQFVDVNVVDGWIYLLRFSWDSERVEVRRMRLDGTERSVLMTSDSERYSNMNVAGEWIYYMGNPDSKENWGIYRVGIDGTRRTELLRGRSGVKMLYLNVTDGWVYYFGGRGAGGLYRMRADGTGLATVLEETAGDNLNVVGDWVYYRDADSYRIRSDGTGLEKL